MELLIGAVVVIDADYERHNNRAATKSKRKPK